jgi:predicted Ser/Thr protein kinase
VNGQRVGSYEIVRTLARGGMAVVYLARQPALDRVVALKQLDFESDDPTLAPRFVREARLAGALEHPNVVTLFDFFIESGVPYMAMEYVAGGSLRPLVGKLRPAQIFGVLEGVLAGLGHAEEHGVAHRDLKPENVLIARRGVKIADFGIARAYDALTHSFTSTGAALGTPAYMAPEQVLDERLGPYTDLYAVGVIAYELIARRPPFDPRALPMSILFAHVHRQPPPLTELAPDVPLPVCRWVESLLAKAPADRPASAAAAWEALEEIVVDGLGPYWRRDAEMAPPAHEEEPEAATRRLRTTPQIAATSPPAPPAPTSRRRSRRRRRVAAIVLGTAAAGVAAALVVAALDDAAPPKGASVRPPAAPFDFDRDGRQELAVGMPGSGRGGRGLLAVHGPKGMQPITGRRGPDPGGFGTAAASADFDGDGWADLAVGVPGRSTVEVFAGAAAGLRYDRSITEPGSGYGSALAAADLDRDGFGDLVVGAPGRSALYVQFGDAGGLRRGGRTITGGARFGSRVRTGDVDGDGDVDVVEGAPDRPPEPGHASFCAGSRRGPRACDTIGVYGTSALAVADVDGDEYYDIVQGDAVDVDGIAPVGGRVAVWFGSHEGPTGEPLELYQGTRWLNRWADEPGDGFGASVDAGDLDGDGFADIVVGTPGENQRIGSFAVIRGGRDGLADASTGGIGFGDRGVTGTRLPGRRIGSGVAIVPDPDGDGVAVAVTVPGADRLRDAVLVFRRGAGAFAPGEVEASPLDWDDVASPRLERLRLVRLATH